MVRHLALAAALLAMGTAGGAAAPESGGNADVRCLLLSNFFARAAKEDKSRELAALSRFFYLGRIAGRMTPAALKTAMEKESAAIPPEQTADAMAACLARVDKENKALAAVGGQIKPPAGAAGPVGPAASPSDPVPAAPAKPKK